MDEISELSKEVFARFGVAYHASEVLHRGLCDYYVLATFESPQSATGPRFDEKFSYGYSLTLGQIIRETKDFFPSEIQSLLSQALVKRNYLAHHFWFEKNHLMFNKKGLLAIQQELINYADFFTDLDKSITKKLRPLVSEFGITDDIFQSTFKEARQGKEMEPLLSQRTLKKQERIVRIWDVEVNTGMVMQIFETEDGELWQLADVGLGWSRYTKPQSTWRINKKLQEYLPATINPRPLTSKSWTYTFKLSKGIIFWVKPGKKERNYSWGIKRTKNCDKNQNL